jgi:hypothetical protein
LRSENETSRFVVARSRLATKSCSGTSSHRLHRTAEWIRDVCRRRDQKKQVPIDVVTDPAQATFKLKAALVGIKQKSTGGTIARCMFAYCIGIEEEGNVSVQLIEAGSSVMLWAYSVNKQRGGSKNQQSMAEAVAKHFIGFLANAQPAVQAAIEAAAMAPPPTTVPGPPVVAPARAPATRIAYQHQDNAHIEPAMQAEPQLDYCLQIDVLTCSAVSFPF